MSKKILINTPFINYPGGVANHYLGLRLHFSKNVVYNQFYTSSNVKKIFYNKPIYKIFLPIFYMLNLIKYLSLTIFLFQPIVVLNPSFRKTALKRDLIYIRIAKFFGCKVAVFMHGWDKEYLNLVLTNKEYFSSSWKKVDLYFVLANEFKEYLIKLGFKSPIHLTTTKVNDKLIEGVNSKNITKIKTILFLARVEKAKGIITTIEALELLNQKYPEINLRVVGSGNYLEETKKYCNDRKIDNIIFTGPLFGEDLKNEFINADLYILPSHGEGMPTSVLEAMAFGLTVITRPVGGLVDFFENDKMGYMIESLDAKDYAEKIEYLINNIEKANEISKYNMKYAKNHFIAPKVAKRLEDILTKI